MQNDIGRSVIMTAYYSASQVDFWRLTTSVETLENQTKPFTPEDVIAKNQDYFNEVTMDFEYVLPRTTTIIKALTLTFKWEYNSETDCLNTEARAIDNCLHDDYRVSRADMKECVTQAMSILKSVVYPQWCPLTLSLLNVLTLDPDRCRCGIANRNHNAQCTEEQAPEEVRFSTYLVEVKKITWGGYIKGEEKD